MHWLCFSASSHYPWVDDGLPVVARARDGRYAVSAKGGEGAPSEPCGLEPAVERIEAMLAASPVAPYFGSAPHHFQPRLSEALARAGSTVRAQLVQRAAWYDLVVASSDGERRCVVDFPAVAFLGAGPRRDARFATVEASAAAIEAWCSGEGD